MKKIILVFVLCFSSVYATTDYMSFTGIKNNVIISVNFLEGRFLSDSFMIPVVIMNKSKKDYIVTKQDYISITIGNRTYNFKLYQFKSFEVIKVGKTKNIEFNILFKDYPQHVFDNQIQIIKSMVDVIQFKNEKEKKEYEKSLSQSMPAVYYPFENESINLNIKFIKRGQ